MAISIIEPVSRAMEETRRSLFEPLRMNKWFVVGLGAWLASFVAGGGGGFNPSSLGNLQNLGTPRGARPRPPAPPVMAPPVMAPQPVPGQVPLPGVPGQIQGGDGKPIAEPGMGMEVQGGMAGGMAPGQVVMEPGDVNVVVQQADLEENEFATFVKDATNWLKKNLPLVVGLGLVLLLLIVGLTLVLTWLGTRGQFMLLDNIARNRAEVGEPWSQYAREANSLFWFLILFSLASFLTFLVILGSAVGLAWGDIRAQNFGAGAIAGIVLLVVLWIPLAVVLSFVRLFLLDFVVPIMYSQRLKTMEAWGVFRESVWSGHVGSLVLYALFKWIPLGIVLGIISFIVTLFTCCIAGLPYIGSVILLPLSYFTRCYTLAFLEQFDPKFRILGGAAKPSSNLSIDPDFLV